MVWFVFGLRIAHRDKNGGEFGLQIDRQASHVRASLASVPGGLPPWNVAVIELGWLFTLGRHQPPSDRSGTHCYAASRRRENLLSSIVSGGAAVCAAQNRCFRPTFAKAALASRNSRKMFASESG